MFTHQAQNGITIAISSATIGLSANVVPISIEVTCSQSKVVSYTMMVPTSTKSIHVSLSSCFNEQIRSKNYKNWSNLTSRSHKSNKIGFQLVQTSLTPSNTSKLLLVKVRQNLRATCDLSFSIQFKPHSYIQDVPKGP